MIPYCFLVSKTIFPLFLSLFSCFCVVHYFKVQKLNQFLATERLFRYWIARIIGVQTPITNSSNACNSSFVLGAIPILRQQKDWVGGFRKWPILLTFSTVFMLIRWVGGVQKGQKYADVIQGWSLKPNFFNKQCFFVINFFT